MAELRQQDARPHRVAGRPSAVDPAGELAGLAGDCVHCGFCLPACPTYQLWGEEMDSPRGRIHLITQILDGAEPSPAAALHLDRCLGCMACVPVCPSGVRYDRLIEAARAWAAPAGRAGPGAGGPPALLPPRALRERIARAAIFATFPYPARLRLALASLHVLQRAGLDRRLAGSAALNRFLPELAAALRVAPRPGAAGASGARRATTQTPVPAAGQCRARVAVLTGCAQRVFFPGVNQATIRVLAAEGCEVIVPQGQGCCGALSLHGGRTAEAARFARATIAALDGPGIDAVIVNAAGCGSAMKEYGQLLSADPARAERAAAQRAAAFSAKVRDLTEFLAGLGPVAVRHPLPVRAAYHDPCHLGHAQRITAEPRDLLAAIPGLELAEIPDGAVCCGSAGIYNLIQPEPAAELGHRKAAAIRQTGADLLVSANPGCLLQISAALAADGSPMPVAHIAEVLDASIRGLPPRHLLG
jgi:glycolate oxidase iron-sulfur subunit